VSSYALLSTAVTLIAEENLQELASTNTIILNADGTTATTLLLLLLLLPLYDDDDQYYVPSIHPDMFIFYLQYVIICITIIINHHLANDNRDV
jgi:hypothetical protein